MRIEEVQIYGSKTDEKRSTRELRVATWNLLAPPYAKDIEKDEWRSRLVSQQRQLEILGPDVAALQEFWVDDEALKLWAEWAEAQNYSLVVLPRTRGKADGCATLVRADLLWRRTRTYGLGYDDWGDRVCLVVPVGGILFANTHWTFAHQNAWDPVMRRHQARKLTEHLDGTRRVVVLGDLNGEKSDPALQILQSAGFTLHDPHWNWKSHYAHTDQLLACDFIASKDLHVDNVVLHGEATDLCPRPPPDFRVSDHLMLSATLHLDDDDYFRSSSP